MSRTIPEAINAPFRRLPGAARGCQHPGCREAGEYRAPVSRERLNEYYWFCLEHVREYNQAWDYFAGMSEAEIEQQRRADTVWQRPSWPLGRFGERGAYGARVRMRDGFGFFAEDEAGRRAPRPMTEEQKALVVLDLEEPVTFDDVRARYKTLVKKLHPDANGGDREAEERLKSVNQAYAALKVSFA
ncbi:MAG: J domain-containing protein [Kiloniellaceae bacterium]